MPRAIASTMARNDSSIVAGRRSRKTWNASSPGSTFVDTPKLPCTARSMNFRYCTGSGWSSPSAASRAATRSGVWRSPRIADTGPPGSDRSHRKTSIDKTMTTTHICRRRRTTKRITGSPHTPARVLGPALGRPPDLARVGRSAVGVLLPAVDRHGVELLSGERARDHTVHTGTDHQGRRRVADGQAREVVLHDLLVDVREGRGPLVLVDHRVGGLEVVGELRAPRH